MKKYLSRLAPLFAPSERVFPASS